MSKKELVTVKHQAYRCRGKEVVLDRESKFESDHEGKPKRVTHWLVREIGQDGSDFTLGAPFEVRASELSLMGRAIPVTEEIAA